MDIVDFLVNATAGGLGAAAAGAIFMKAYESRLAIEVEKLREAREQAQKQRDASAAAVDIISAWVKPTYLGRNLTNEERWELQTNYWKNILLLDVNLAKILFSVLGKSDDNPGTNELIVRVRQHMLGLEEPDISAGQLNNWKPNYDATNGPEPNQTNTNER